MKADYIRVIPCLDIKGGRVVKGVHFTNLRDAADPVEAAVVYDQGGADEITFLDIAASVEHRPTMRELARRVCEAISVPLIVGGGIGSLSDIELLLAAGVRAVSLNTAAVREPELVREAAAEFGSERIIVAIDGRKNPEMVSGYEVVTHGGTRGTGQDVMAWAARVADLGAGQILPTSMETDGVKDGYDLPLTRGCAEASGLPVIASGGAGKLEHFYQVVTEGQAAAVLAASVFHFGEIPIQAVKEYLAARGVPVRVAR